MQHKFDTAYKHIMQHDKVDQLNSLNIKIKRKNSTLDGPKTSNFQQGRLIAFQKKYNF